MKARKLIVVCFAIVAVFSWTGAASGALMHYWDFEDAVAGTSDDLADTANLYVGNGGYTAQPLTPIAGTTITATGRDGGVSVQSGMSGPCYEAAGLTQIDTPSFTMEGWMQWGNTYRGWANPFGTWGQTVMIHMGGSKFWVGVGPVTYCDYGVTDPAVGDWIFLAVVADATAGTVTGYFNKDGDTLTGYDQTVADVYAGVSTGNAFRVGMDYKTHDGLYDWVVFYDQALPEATINDHYLNGLGLVLIPEPATLGILALGGLGLLLRRKRR